MTDFNSTLLENHPKDFDALFDVGKKFNRHGYENLHILDFCYKNNIAVYIDVLENLYWRLNIHSTGVVVDHLEKIVAYIAKMHKVEWELVVECLTSDIFYYYKILLSKNNTYQYVPDHFEHYGHQDSKEIILAEHKQKYKKQLAVFLSKLKEKESSTDYKKGHIQQVDSKDMNSYLKVVKDKFNKFFEDGFMLKNYISDYNLLDGIYDIQIDDKRASLHYLRLRKDDVFKIVDDADTFKKLSAWLRPNKILKYASKPSWSPDEAACLSVNLDPDLCCREHNNAPHINLADQKISDFPFIEKLKDNKEMMPNFSVYSSHPYLPSPKNCWVKIFMERPEIGFKKFTSYFREITKSLIDTYIKADFDKTKALKDDYPNAYNNLVKIEPRISIENKTSSVITASPDQNPTSADDESAIPIKPAKQSNEITTMGEPKETETNDQSPTSKMLPDSLSELGKKGGEKSKKRKELKELAESEHDQGRGYTKFVKILKKHTPHKTYESGVDADDIYLDGNTMCYTLKTAKKELHESIQITSMKQYFTDVRALNIVSTEQSTNTTNS